MHRTVEFATNAVFCNASWITRASPEARQALGDNIPETNKREILDPERRPWASLHSYRPVGLVVKASASRVEDPGLESRLRRVFFGVE